MICGKCGREYERAEEYASDIACGKCEEAALDAVVVLCFMDDAARDEVLRRLTEGEREKDGDS